MARTARGIAGQSAACKAARYRFDSCPRLHAIRYWIRHPLTWLRLKWRARRMGQIFGGRAGEWRRRLKASAWNRSYVPPRRSDWLARDVIGFLEEECNRYKEEMIAAKRALSRERRTK